MAASPRKLEKDRHLAAQKAARKARMAAGHLTTGEKSLYAQKVARKLGSGSVDPRWMWWTSPRTGEA